MLSEDGDIVTSEAPVLVLILVLMEYALWVDVKQNPKSGKLLS